LAGSDLSLAASGQGEITSSVGGVAASGLTKSSTLICKIEGEAAMVSEGGVDKGVNGSSSVTIR
jgi:hypothetical protein